MCGIIAYTGKRQAAGILYDGLTRLEYRGYDSAGIAVVNGLRLDYVKRAGRVSAVVDARALSGTCGVGHTRWATHGGAEDKNAHPHVCGKFAVVHNGIIENYAALKRELTDMGHSFSSDTDSETVSHLLSSFYRGDFLSAVRQTVEKLRGSFALCVLCSDFPETIVCVRQKSPLILGRAKDGMLAASDIPALGGCREICVLSDGQIACLTPADCKLFSFSLAPLPCKFTASDLKSCVAEKKGFAHFMRKEISQEGAAVVRTARAFDEAEARRLFGCVPYAEVFSRIFLVGCGTAYHSALTGARLLEETLRIPVAAELASEFYCRKPLLGRHALVLAVSQSGETADTLAAARLAKQKGARLAVLTNAGYSSLARLSDHCFLTEAGVEVGVAATKTYAAQLAFFYALCAFLRGEKAAYLRRFPAIHKKLSEGEEQIRLLAAEIVRARGVYFIGRGADYASALEGSLKLREVSYLPGAGYAAGELKHGSIALMDGDAVVVAVATGKALKEKMRTSVCEVRSRGAKVIAVTPFDDIPADHVLALPACPQKYYPLLTQVPLQLLAYHAALCRGLDPDRPRNLAKSVTVE